MSERKKSKILRAGCPVCIQEVDTYTDEGVLKIENHNYRDSDLQCSGSGYELNKTTDENEKLLEEAIAAVNLFDQANTGGAIELLGSRGVIAKGAIDNLRNVINKDRKLTILIREQASGNYKGKGKEM